MKTSLTYWKHLWPASRTLKEKNLNDKRHKKNIFGQWMPIQNSRSVYLFKCNFIQNSITDLRNIHSFKTKMFRKIFEVSFGHLKMSDYLKKTHPPCYPVYLDRRRNTRCKCALYFVICYYILKRLYFNQELQLSEQTL